MRIPLLLFSALCIVLLAPRIRAQEGGDDAPPAQNEAGPPMGQPPAQQEGESSPPVGMSMDDARVNMFTLLQSFLAARQIDGVWPLKNKGDHNRLLKLRLEDKELKKIRPSGTRRYSGILAFTDVRTGKPYDCDFMVDMGGSEWQVVGMKLSAGKKRPAKKGKAKGKKEEAAPPADDAPPPDDAGGEPASGDAQ